MFVTKKQSERECEEELVKCRDRCVRLCMSSLSKLSHCHVK